MGDFVEQTLLVNEKISSLERIIRNGLYNDRFHLTLIERMFPGLIMNIPEGYVAPREIQYPVNDMRARSRNNIERYTQIILDHFAEQMGIALAIEVVISDEDNNDSNDDDDEDIIVLTEEAQSMEEPGTLINLDRNHTIDFIPYHEIIESTHRQIFETESTEKIDLENLVNTKLYLMYCEKYERFTLCKAAKEGSGRLKNSPWKTSCWFQAEIVQQFERSIFAEHMKLSTSLAKQFKASNIEIFWKSTADGHLHISFFVDTTIIPVTFLHANEKFSQLCQTQVAPKINEFLLGVIPKGSISNLDVWTQKNDKEIDDPGNFQRFFGALEKWTREWKITDNFEIRENLLTCKLMDYQRTTVKWMLERELQASRVDYFDLFASFEFKPPTNSTNQTSLFYFPAFGFFTQSSLVADDFTAKGGILADEMGLGKTIEMLALIMTNGKDEVVRISEEQDDQRRRDKSRSPVYRKKIVSEEDLTRNRFNWDEYHTAKRVDKSMGSAIVYTVTDENLKGSKGRPQTSRDDETLYRKCEKCKELCVLSKCGWKDEFEGKFWCPQCMASKEPLEVKTTLIVLPESLVLQWFDEISRHCSEHLKVMFYFGLNKNGYLHPQEIADYDVILTTYDTLRTELDFANFKNTNHSRLRNGQRSAHKFSPTSITHVFWWRLVADESQLVEGAARRAPKMCNMISAHNRWCLTGTPIVRNVSDLHGLFRFINFWPFNVETFWRECVIKEYLQKETDSDLPDTWLLRLAGQVMRRNSKKMVEDEIRLPKLIEIERKIEMSTIEERQYKEETEKVKDVVEKAIGQVPNEVMLSTMAGRERTLAALGKLRETLISCGEHVNFHKQKNMYEQVVFGPESVMLRLIRAKKTQIEEHLRMSMSALCGMAGILWLQNKHVEVAQVYEKVADSMAVIEDVNNHFKNVMKLEIEDVDVDNSDDEFFEIADEGDDEDENRKLRNRMKEKRVIRQSRVKNELHGLKSCRKRPYTGKERPRKKGAKKIAQSKKGEDDEGLTPKKVAKMDKKSEGSTSQSEEDDDDDEVEESSTRSSPIPETEDQPETDRDDDDEEEQEEGGPSTESDVDKEKVLAQRKAERALHAMQRKAMRPLRIDCTMSSHLFLNMRELQRRPEAAEKMNALVEKLGGMDAMMKEYQFTMLRYVKTEEAGLQIAKSEFEKWTKEWAEHQDEHLGMMRFLSETAVIYKNQIATDPKVSPYSLTSKVLASSKIAPLLTDLSAWPVFVKSRQHSLDGQDVIDCKVLNKEVRRSPHNPEKCMGLCNGITFEEVTKPYEKTTDCDLLYRMEKFIDFLEFVRIYIFTTYAKMLDFFANKSFNELVNLQETITEESLYVQNPEGAHNIIRCDHEKMDDGKVIMTPEIMKRQQSNKCHLCAVRYGLMFLRYEMGISSYHGYTKHGPSPLIPFYTLVCGFERRKNTSIAFKQHLGDFRNYVDRLRRTTQSLQSSLIIIEEYSNRIQEMTYAKFRLSIRSLRANKNRHNDGKNDEELKQYYYQSYEAENAIKEEKVKTACLELRYLAFLYDKERNGTADGDENSCLICGNVMLSLVVFPCGHRICETCYEQVRSRNDNQPARLRAQVECVTCRGRYNPRLIMVARVGNRNTENNVIPGVTLAMKLEKSIELMREIIAENSQNKIILFTTLEIGTHIWRFLTKVLQKAKMPFIEISRSEYGKRVFTFEFSDDCKILLCSLSMCANGLNLTQANHIIFLDPTHLSSVVAQAIGRISRYGQSREMKVYHMIAKSSIDEELRRIATAEGAEPGLLQQKERTGWTVGEIRQIFGITG